ncbi:immunity 49 family protein [Kitasatospora sp. NPDC086009]|uniref:immunity 49 family protein n=1 Tax=unclassified Kitasatospora TaxID=2633591 RepID=UPI0037C6C5CC
MQEVTCHKVDDDRIARALDDIGGQSFNRWHSLRYDSLSIGGLVRLQGELLDHVGARTLSDPALTGPSGRDVLRAAAECALGVLALGSFPNGDFEVYFPLNDQTLDSGDFAFGDAVDDVSTARTWLDTFALCVTTDLLHRPERVVGPLLKDDYAPAIRDGVPYSPLESVSDPGDLAAMDALCGYLADMVGTWPATRVAPEPITKPDAQARAEAARRLDAAGALTPDQRLLRVLLDDDRAAFEHALTERLGLHRDGVGPDPEPRTLLPVETVALAALAVRAHGWQLETRSGYLPEGLLADPQE